MIGWRSPRGGTLRVRTMIVAGMAAAAAGYLSHPTEGHARRRRIRSLIGSFIPARGNGSAPAPLPENFAPRAFERPAIRDLPAVELPASAGPTPGDAEIVRLARTTLEGRRDLGADDLVVDVVNGVAYLTGDLRDPQTFGEVVDLVRDVNGVRRVQSLLHLPDSELIVRTIASGPRSTREGS